MVYNIRNTVCLTMAHFSAFISPKSKNVIVKIEIYKLEEEKRGPLSFSTLKLSSCFPYFLDKSLEVIKSQNEGGFLSKVTTVLSLKR